MNPDNVPRETLQKTNQYSDLLQTWSKKINLTTIKSPRDIWHKHFLDSWQLHDYIVENKLKKVADLGSGAGFPGLALALVCPNTHFFLVEAVAKKIKFLQLIQNKLGIANVTIIQKRVEDLYLEDSYQNFFDLVAARAFAYLPIFLELGFGLVKPKGVMVAYKSERNIVTELQTSKPFSKKHFIAFDRTIPYSILKEKRVLCFFQKKAIINPYRPRSLKKLKRIYLLSCNKNN